jgi:hypothetical protein
MRTFRPHQPLQHDPLDLCFPTHLALLVFPPFLTRSSEAAESTPFALSFVFLAHQRQPLKRPHSPLVKLSNCQAAKHLTSHKSWMDVSMLASRSLQKHQERWGLYEGGSLSRTRESYHIPGDRAQNPRTFHIRRPDPIFACGAAKKRFVVRQRSKSLLAVKGRNRLIDFTSSSQASICKEREKGRQGGQRRRGRKSYVVTRSPVFSALLAALPAVGQDYALQDPLFTLAQPRLSSSNSALCYRLLLLVSSNRLSGLCSGAVV